jgi:glutamate racemase
LEGLRQALSIPVIGTVPAIKPAAQLSATRHIGLLATTATVNRPYTQGLIDSFASDCRVTKIAADALVTEAEAWLAGVPLDMSRVQQALTPLWQATKAHPALDTVVLGCTHFPLLQPQLVTLAPVPITWVDSGDAIARRVGQVATTLVSSAHDGRCYTTAPATALTDGFARYGFQPPRLLALPDAREAVDQ